MSKKGDSENVVELTQEALNAMFAERARRAAESAVSDLLSRLGVASEEELQTQLNRISELEQQLTEQAETDEVRLQEAQQVAEQTQQTLTQRVQAFKEQLLKTESARLAGTLGFVEQAVEDVQNLVVSGALEGVELNEESWEISGLEDALKTLAEAKPHWVEKQPSPPQRFTPGRETNLGRRPDSSPKLKDDGALQRVRVNL